MSVVVKFHRLPHGEGLPFPAYARDGDSGLDLPAASWWPERGRVVVMEESVEAVVRLSLGAGQRMLVGTGCAVELPPGYEAQVRPRSGLADRHGVTVLNSPGTIDNGYRGEVCVLLVNHSEDAVVIKRGDRIAQLVVAPVVRANVVEVEELSETERGTGGMGSTGS